MNLTDNVVNDPDPLAKNSSLAELIQATMASLSTDQIARDDGPSRLQALFSRAQMAKVEPKIPLSL
jgi:hypothetical protein